MPNIWWTQVAALGGEQLAVCDWANDCVVLLDAATGMVQRTIRTINALCPESGTSPCPRHGSLGPGGMFLHQNGQRYGMAGISRFRV